MNFNYERTTTDKELHQILAIQKRNMKSSLPLTEVAQEGFLTVAHDFDILKRMNDACAHIVVKDGDSVAGYALTMLRTFRNEIPVLAPMFDEADTLLGDKNYMVMGQICIDRPYRKKGLFKGMYLFYREELQNRFDCLFTEVATDNQRSFSAHKSVGFEVLKTQITNGISWELMNWDWKRQATPLP